MSSSIKTFGLIVRNSPALNGGLTIQPIRPTLLPGSSVGTPGGSGGAPGSAVPSISTTPGGSGIPGGSGGISGIVGGTISNPGAVDAIAAGRLGLPIDSLPAVRFAPPTAHLIKETYSVDSMNVSQTRLANGEFKPVMDGGIVPFRPEILSLIDYSPIFKLGNRLRNGPTGDFIDVQYQASHLREGTLLKLVEKIQRTSRTTASDDAFRTVRNNFTAEISRVENHISQMQDILTNVNNVKTSLEVKKIPSTFYNLTNFLSPEDFFVRRMSYKRKQYAAFSDTKVLLQLLFDFRSILEGYSISLLDLKDPDRETDYSPIAIDKTYTQTNGFSFSLGNIRSVTTPINATETGFFTQFLSSLPQDPDDRIRILTTLLGKEYLVSRGLGRQDLQRLLQGLGLATTGNPFDNIIGEVGGTIFEKPKGERSIASLMFIDPGIPDANVLPFESKYVDSEDQKSVYVPGSSYFVDSILNTTGDAWNTKPYINFINLYNNRIKEARNVIEEFLSLKDLQILLAPGTLSDSCMNSVKAAISTLTDPSSVSGDQAVVTALFRLASTSTELKGMLFQFAILVGMAANGETLQREIFDLLGRSEITSLRKLSYLEIPAGVEPSPARGQAVIKPYIEQLADAIEQKVVSLTSKNLSDYSRFMRTTNFLQRLRPYRSSWLTPALGGTSSLRSDLIGSLGISSGPKKEQSVTVHVQRGNIARILKNITASGGDNRTNFIEEFVGLSTNLFKAAQSQGANVHLLQDGTNRTRYNFLSISTQLLMLFEIFSSYANRYAFASFEKTMFETESLISVDTTGCHLTVSVIDDLTKKPLLSNYRDLVATTVSPSLDRLRDAFGSSVAPGPATIRGTSLSPPTPGVITTPGTQIRRIAGTADGGLGGNPLRFIPTSLSSISSELRAALRSRPGILNSLSTGALSNAGGIRDITDVNGNIERLRNALVEADKYIPYKVSLGNTRRKIYDELNIVANCLHILTAVGQFLQKGADKVNSAFTQTSLQNFIRINGEYGLQLLKNASQSRVATATLQNIKDKAPASDYSSETGYVHNGLVISDTTTLQEYRCLRALLSSDVYLNSSGLSPSANNRVKLLSVGVPAGFSTQLADRVNIGEINANSYRDKEFDAILVNVYKRDARFDDLVFKPQKFLFDLSLFVLEKDINDIQPGADEPFSRMMEKAKVTDYTNLTSPKKLTLATIRNDERYNFLTEEEKRNLLHSHISSYLLSLYINFLTGMRVTEDSFLQGASSGRTRDLNQELQRIVYTYLRDVMRQNIPAGRTVTELLQSPAISEEAKDVLRLFDYGSLVFNEREVTYRVLTPKQFDRIFHIPLNIENFEVDVDKTLSTESGRRVWRQSYLQEKLERRGDKYFLKPRPKNELIFEDYFVAIETANDKENP